MNTVDCIKSRRSIRRFKPDSVKHSLVEEIISAASFSHPGKILRLPVISQLRILPFWEKLLMTLPHLTIQISSARHRF